MTKSTLSEVLSFKMTVVVWCSGGCSGDGVLRHDIHRRGGDRDRRY